MIRATLREDANTLHHIQGESMREVLATAGLLAEAINYRHGFNRGNSRAQALPLNVSRGIEGGYTADKYTIREKGVFWLDKLSD